VIIGLSAPVHVVRPSSRRYFSGGNAAETAKVERRPTVAGRVKQNCNSIIGAGVIAPVICAPSFDVVRLDATDCRRLVQFRRPRQLHVPRTRTCYYGDRSFLVNGPAVWNSLPVELRSPGMSVDILKIN